MTVRSALVALIMATLLGGCETTSYVMVGQRHPPTYPGDVKVYLSAPSSYESIAILNSDSRNSWAFTSQQKMDLAMDRLVETAASLGANGILLESTGDRYNGSVGSTFVAPVRGLGLLAGSAHIPVFIKEAKGVAIYVNDDRAQPTAAPLPQQSTAPVANTTQLQVAVSVPPSTGELKSAPPAKRNPGATFGPSDLGLSVVAVERDGSAARAGLKRGDIITQINERDIAALYWKNAEALLVNSGDTIELEVFGKGRRTLSLAQ